MTYDAQAKTTGEPVKDEKPAEPKDTLRETIETIVFVVFLVVLLRAFVAEAFVIPSGSMATTLEGNHRRVTCVACGHHFSTNADEPNGYAAANRVVCPNCQCDQPLLPKVHPIHGGAKVLVFKSPPRYQRLDVIVFKFPGTLKPVKEDQPPKWDGGPQEHYGAKNYIKRLWGLPGEKLKIWYGDVYVWGRDGKEEWQIIRKPPDKMLEMRRLVFDNDHWPANLDRELWRWRDADTESPRWKASEDGREFALEGGEALAWLEYNHTPDLNGWKSDAAPRRVPPQLVLDVLGYNSVFWQPGDEGGFPPLQTPRAYSQPTNWVGDLMLECEVDVTDPSGEVILELHEGVDAYQAVFTPSDGTCTLRVIREGEEVKSEQRQTNLKGAGRHQVRFANFDDRLTLWVNGKLPYEEGMEFDAPAKEKRGPRLADVRPAAIGAKGGGVTVRKLQVWRDLYYREAAGENAPPSDVSLGLKDVQMDGESERKLVSPQLPLEDRRRHAHKRPPDKWELLQGSEMPVSEYPGSLDNHPGDRLGPDEYFALGDNSTQSSDSRVFGVVPERMLLGKAVLVYWPPSLSRWGFIR